MAVMLCILLPDRPWRRGFVDGAGGFPEPELVVGRAGSREAGSLGAQVHRVCQAPSLSLF